MLLPFPLLIRGRILPQKGALMQELIPLATNICSLFAYLNKPNVVSLVSLSVVSFVSKFELPFVLGPRNVSVTC